MKNISGWLWTGSLGAVGLKIQSHSLGLINRFNASALEYLRHSSHHIASHAPSALLAAGLLRPLPLRGAVHFSVTCTDDLKKIWSVKALLLRPKKHKTAAATHLMCGVNV